MRTFDIQQMLKDSDLLKCFTRFFMQKNVTVEDFLKTFFVKKIQRFERFHR